MNLDQIGAGVSAAGVAIALLYGAVKVLVPLARALRVAFRKLDAIEVIVGRELEHNHGSSMKDDVHGIAIALGSTQRDVDDIKNALRRQHPDDPMFWKDKKR